MTMSDKYILDANHQPVPCDDLLEWGRWFEKAKRHVAQDFPLPDVRVSTVFLGLDHSWGIGAPLLFETMIFGGEHDQFQERYHTWEEAEEGHKRALALVQP